MASSGLKLTHEALAVVPCAFAVVPSEKVPIQLTFSPQNCLLPEKNCCAPSKANCKTCFLYLQHRILTQRRTADVHFKTKQMLTCKYATSCKPVTAIISRNKHSDAQQLPFIIRSSSDLNHQCFISSLLLSIHNITVISYNCPRWKLCQKYRPTLPPPSKELLK